MVILPIALALVLGSVPMRAEDAALPATYSSINEKIFKNPRKQCANCHGLDANNGLILVTYEGLMRSPLVTPFDADRSLLYSAVVRQDGKKAPEMPKLTQGQPEPEYLTESETVAIYTWIANGALDN